MRETNPKQSMHNEMAIGSEQDACSNVFSQVVAHLRIHGATIIFTQTKMKRQHKYECQQRHINNGTN